MSETITIDQSGRLVVPKLMREQLHLSGGEEMTVRLVGDHLELEPKEAAPILEKRGKRTVVTNWEDFNAVEAVAEARRQVERGASTR